VSAIRERAREGFVQGEKRVIGTLRERRSVDARETLIAIGTA